MFQVSKINDVPLIYYGPCSIYHSDSQVLFTTLCNAEPLRGFAIYFMRASTKKSLGEEAFQVSKLNEKIFVHTKFRERFLLVP